jgi:hypothetical protein
MNVIGYYTILFYTYFFGSTANMASPLPLQHANTVCYVGDFSFLLDHLVLDWIWQRNRKPLSIAL